MSQVKKFKTKLGLKMADSVYWSIPGFSQLNSMALCIKLYGFIVISAKFISKFEIFIYLSKFNY